MRMASTAVASPPSLNHRELDAAQALLGVSPSTGQDGHEIGAHGFIVAPAPVSGGFDSSEVLQGASLSPPAQVTSDESLDVEKPFPRRPRSDSAGLEALAMLAESESANLQQDEPLAPFIMSASPSESSEDDDSESAMPPPSPRRRRSISNPEGMEKWDSLSSSSVSGRRHFVLPQSILEEELAEASEAMRRHDLIPQSIPEDSEFLGDDEEEEDAEEETEDLSHLTPVERLVKARSKLLEDLSEGNLTGEKGVIALPHSLAKYKNIYNKNGRIGIYTPDERAAVIERFKSKRGRRVWNKKIRYGCRKNLADRRLRVKGRFVKREEQEALAKELKKQAEKVKCEGTTDADMPDVDDPEAGFSPTEDQPYRRLRRHTIT